MAKTKGSEPETLTSKQFLTELMTHQIPSQADESRRFFRDADEGTKFIGIRMGTLFALTKKFSKMPLVEIEKLLDNDYYEARMGAVGMMDLQARDKKLPDTSRKKLFDLYISKHDRIDNWDLVDRGAPYIVGGYLFEKPRAILYKLAKSKKVWERRTAIVSTYFFIRQNDIEDTFKIAELLVNDKHDLIQKAVGSWIREAGKRDSKRLIQFLDKHAHAMPRVTLRYATEKLSKKIRAEYLEKK